MAWVSETVADFNDVHEVAESSPNPEPGFYLPTASRWFSWARVEKRIRECSRFSIQKETCQGGYSGEKG